MIFANPWGLLGLLALPTIVLIHMYHRRFPPLVVAGAHLWTSETKQNLEGRRRETLPITPSLLLELLAALLLSLILAEPHWGSFGEAVHLVVVLDNSASMMGLPPEPNETTFRDAAVAELKRRQLRVPRGSVFTLILTGARPEMLAGPAVPWSDVEAKLASWRPALPRHAFEPAWDMGLQLTEKQGQLLFLTDHLPPEKDIPNALEVVSVGRRLNNASLAASRWTYDSVSGTGRIFVRVQNHGRDTVSVDVSGTARESELFRKSVTLAADGAASIEAEVKGGTQELLIQLQSKGDGLELDNVARLIEPKVRTVHVANSLPDGDAGRMLKNALKSIPDVQVEASASADLVFAPAAGQPPLDPRLWWLGIGPLSTTEAARKQAQDLAGPYLLEKRNPLLEGVVLSGVIWGGVQRMPPGVTPLISAGSKTLLGRLDGPSPHVYLLNIDFSRSNLGESPDWPIFLSNLVELRRSELPGLQRWNYRIGEDVNFRLYEGRIDPAPAAPLVLVHGQQTKPIIRSETIELTGLNDIGAYEVKQGDKSIGRFAMNFQDAEESDLKNLAAGRRAAIIPEATSEISVNDPYTLMMMAGVVAILVALLADWYVLRRR